ncbi:uncharacterized protein LOC134675658 [Cydia fagiglandana]|uniref:uncharacterized protein LOC134675658 n=1 Tax=Cydia fagiglandana TaxID=1458189 RepID=UPI002FEDEA3A
MVSNSRYCEICGARELYKRGFFARFPKDEQRCKTWVKIVGKKDLVHIPIEKLHQIRHICGDHFAPKDFGKTRGKLKKRAFPKLQLSAPPLSDYQLRGFPQHTASQQGTTGTSNTAAIENVRTLQPVEFQFQFHQYCKGKTTQSPVDVEPAKSESSKLDSDLIDTGDHIETDAFDNDSPPKPVPGLPESDTTSRNIFSWQTAELIEADASDDPTPTPVPEQPKLPDDVVTLSLFCDDDAPIQSESIDLGKSLCKTKLPLSLPSAPVYSAMN